MIVSAAYAESQFILIQMKMEFDEYDLIFYQLIFGTDLERHILLVWFAEFDCILS